LKEESDRLDELGLERRWSGVEGGLMVVVGLRWWSCLKGWCFGGFCLW
jgi:hypothetical protein